jgi:choline-sulfatase
MWTPRRRDLLLGAPAALLGACVGRRDEERPNVLVVDVDSLRADRIGRGLAPALDALAASGTSFTDALSASSWTLPSFLGLVAGRHPPGALFSATPEAGRLDRLLPSILRAYGYHVAYAWGGTLLSDHPCRARWFGDGATDVGDVEGAAAAVGTLPEPWFLFLHDLDLHLPDGKGRADLTRTLQETGSRDAVIRRYDEALARYDARVAALLAALDRGGRGGRTLVALTSDHGEELFEHDELGHGKRMYETVMRVPLVVRDPAAAGPAQVTTRVQAIDLAPTLLARVGIPVHAEMEGIVLPTMGGDVPERALHAVANGRSAALWQDRWKLVLHPAGCTRDEATEHPPLRHLQCEQLVDLEADPAEAHDLSAREPDRAAAMRADLLAWAGTQDLADASGGNRAFVKVLQANGYWSAEE